MTDPSIPKKVAALAAMGLLLSMAGCSSTPPPTVAELVGQADQLTSNCRHGNGPSCGDLKKSFCDGLGAFIDSQGDKVDLDSTFGSASRNVRKAASGCSGIRIF